MVCPFKEKEKWTWLSQHAFTSSLLQEISCCGGYAAAYNKLIVCALSCHTDRALMGAKCTHPSDSFLICGLRIMCLMLHNNIFFFSDLFLFESHLQSVYFCFFWFCYIYTYFRAFFPSLSHLCLIIFRHQIESIFVFWIQHKNAGSLNYCSKEAHDVPLHDSSAQVWLSTQKFLLICLICSSSACVHTQHGYAFKVWWSIPLWSTWQNSALLMQEEKHQVLGQRAELCQSKPDLLMSQSVHQSVGPTSFSRLQETEKWGVSLLHFPLLSFWSLSGCLFVCSATATSSFFSELFKPRRENAICTHTSDVLHLSQPARQPLTVIK